ncbi:MAG TPA: hypothetical protein VKO84_02915 [Gaiellaceae bacterium]|nr:hypothetical protein [Gaiellaceae bacterium]
MSRPEAQDFSGPRVTELGMLSIGLVAAGVIYLAAYLPKRAPLLPAVILLAGAVAVLAVNVVLILRRPGFARWRFRQVAGWMLLVYLVVAGMLEFTFLRDHTHGAILVLLTFLLATFTLNVPVLAGYTVARFEPLETSEG